MSFSDLIKGKKKVQRWTTTAMVLEEIIETDVLKETTERLVLKYVKTGYSSRDYCLDYGNTGAAQFFQYYLGGRYDYSDVIPKVTLGGAGTPLSAIQDILDGKYNRHVNILEYYTINPAWNRVSYTAPSGANGTVWGSNLDTLIRGYLSSKMDYDFLTNTLYHTDGYTYKYIHRDLDTTSGIAATYTLDMYSTHGSISAATLVRKGTSTTISIPLSIDFTVINFSTNFDSGTTTYSWYWTCVLSPYYYIVYIDPITGRSKLWMYPPLVTDPYWDIRYPDLDLNAFDERDEIGYAKQYNSFESYPIVTIRENRVDVESLKNGNATQQKRYKETVAMLNNLGIPLDTLTEAYLDSSIDNVQVSGATTVNTVLKDVFIQLGVSPANNAEVVSQVLFDFFDKVYAELPNSQNSILYPYTMEIIEGNLNTYYEWVPRQKVRVASTGKPIGRYWHTCEDLPASARTESMTVKVGASYVSTWVDPGIDQASSFDILAVMLPEANPPGTYYAMYLMNGSGQPLRYFFDFNGITYTLNSSQVSNLMDNAKTSGNGQSVIVRTNSGQLDATLTASVSEMYRLSIYKQVTATQADVIYVDNLRSWNGVLAGKTKVENLLMKDGVVNSHFMIPLSVKFIENMSLMQRTDLLSHCIHMCLYIYQNYKLEYREGGILKKLLTVLAVIITVVVSIIAPPAGAAMAGSLGTISAAAISNILTNLFANFLIGMALSIALKVIMRSTGSQTLKYILSAVVMVAAVYLGGGFDGVFDSLTETLKTAVQLADIPIKITEMYVQDQMQGIMQSMNQLQNAATAFFSEYESINEQYSDILKTFNSSISTEYLVNLNRTGDLTGYVMSPSAFLYNATQAHLNLNSLFSNDTETFCSRMLMTGVVDA